MLPKRKKRYYIGARENHDYLTKLDIEDFLVMAQISEAIKIMINQPMQCKNNFVMAKPINLEDI